MEVLMVPSLSLIVIIPVVRVSFVFRFLRFFGSLAVFSFDIALRLVAATAGVVKLSCIEEVSNDDFAGAMETKLLDCKSSTFSINKSEILLVLILGVESLGFESSLLLSFYYLQSHLLLQIVSVAIQRKVLGFLLRSFLTGAPALSNFHP